MSEQKLNSQQATEQLLPYKAELFWKTSKLEEELVLLRVLSKERTVSQRQSERAALLQTGA